MMFRKIFLISLITLTLILDFSLHAQGGGSDDYKEAIAMADQYFKKGDYINAKASYQYALRLSPEEEYPRERLEVTVARLREKMAHMDEYTAVLTEADNLYRKKEYDQAIQKYRAAARIIPAEGYAEEKIREIEDAKDAERKKQVAYDDAIYRADKYVKYRKYEEAIEAYRKAMELKPGEQYPKDQVESLETELDALVEARKQYESIIENADRLYSLKYYENALTEYRKAADARPEDEYPTGQITEIEKLLVKKAEFDKLVDEGDSQYMNKNLPAAKQKYQQALAIYPSEGYPRDMIDKINETMKGQLSAEDLYGAAIRSADKFFAASDYANALQEYTNAADLLPGEAYPKTKIDEINRILEAREQQEEDYALAIKLGDQYLENTVYPEARTQFEKALSIKPDESYPAERLAIVMEALKEQEALEASYQFSIDEGDQHLSKGAFEQAFTSYSNALVIKPGDAYAKAQLKEVEKLKSMEQQTATRYMGTIANADKLMAANSLMAARDNYEQALELDPSAVYPVQQIAEIDRRLETQRSQNAAYNKAIAAADIYFNKQEYDQAKAEYEKAAQIRPDEGYPKSRLDEIEALNAAAAATATATVTSTANVSNNTTGNNANASTPPPSATTAGGTTVIASIPVPQGDEYNETIKEADGLMGLQEYDKARLLYMKAANMKPKETYPKDKIEEIDAIVGKQESDRAEYNRLVAAADRMMESGDYETAEERYNQAIAILPLEQYPKDKLKEIEGIVLAREIDVQNTYNDIIESADKLFASEEYAAARIKYQNALKYKPGESYPQQKIEEIELLSSDLKKKSDQYNKLIVEADNAFTSREYQVAKAKYAEASGLFPEEEHPRVRLEEINLIIRSSNQNAMQSYDKTVADGDKFFSTGAYGQALDAYRKANAMMPDESYPPEMIEKILNILNDNAFRKLLTTSKSIQNGEVEKLTFDPIPVTDRKTSILVIRARGMGIRDFKVFVSYGKGGSKNGGFIMPVKGGDEMKEYIFELGSQYTWFSEDNNWISLTPQGGSIEVTLVEIAKAAAE